VQIILLPSSPRFLGNRLMKYLDSMELLMVDHEFGLPFLVGSSLVVKGEFGLACLVGC